MFLSQTKLKHNGDQTKAREKNNHSGDPFSLKAFVFVVQTSTFLFIGHS